MTSVMHEEALAAAGRVEALLASDEASYVDVAARHARQRPHAVVTVARGSSDHAAAYFGYLHALRSGQVVASMPMSLMTLYDAPLRNERLMAIAVSQSGRSPDVCEPMATLRGQGALTIALVNDPGSPLAHAAAHVLPMHAGEERSVAATKTFICSLVAAARLAGHLAADGPLLLALRELPDALRRAAAHDWRDASLPLLRDADRLMVIGRGPFLPVAQEAALKFKETCGIQAEAFSSAEVRHGPMAIVGAGYPMLVFAPRGPAQADLLALAAEMRCRGAHVLLAAPVDVPHRQLTIETAEDELLDPIVAMPSLYRMVEALSRARGRDPDKPPHLRKVTATV